VKLNFEKVDDKYIAIFRVKEAPHAVYVEYEVGKQNFFIRVGNNSEPLSMIEAIGYVKDKWQ
jgi:predicted HTH transcriptional regulator